MNNRKKSPRDWLAECRRILGTDDRAATYWDTSMGTNEKRVILQAANLPFTPEHQRRKLKAWTSADQRRIKEAAKRASLWAANMELV
jgi:hypothetical protein